MLKRPTETRKKRLITAKRLLIIVDVYEISRRLTVIVPSFAPIVSRREAQSSAAEKRRNWGTLQNIRDLFPPLTAANSHLLIAPATSKFRKTLRAACRRPPRRLRCTPLLITLLQLFVMVRAPPRAARARPVDVMGDFKGGN